MSRTLAIRPQAAVPWAHDVFGNAVAMTTFATMTDMLVIDSVADILLNAAARPVVDIAASAISFHFVIPTTNGPTSARSRSGNIRIRRDGCATGREASSAAIRPIPCA
jgi:hypothetical protein